MGITYVTEKQSELKTYFGGNFKTVWMGKLG